MLKNPKCFDNLLRWRETNPSYQNGNKNPAWKGGLSKSNISRITKRVLLEARIDLYLCQKCGYKSSSPLNRHHRDKNRTNNKLENLAVLCVTCHNSGWHGAEHVRQRDKDTGRWL